jgi:uncharacterized protein YjbI with pentapeptide repeats
MSRRTAVVALVALALASAACSGGSDGASDTTTGPTTGDEPAPTGAPSVPTNEPAASSTTAATTIAPTTEPTTTTEPPPPVVPLGVRWTDGIAVVRDLSGVGRPQLFTIDDDVWLLAPRHNSTIAFRSTDGGESWVSQPMIAPPSSGSLRIGALIARPDGGLLAYGSRGSSCDANVAKADGFREVGLCRRFRPIVALSDDGTSWQVVEPAAMAPPGDVSVRLEAVVATDDGFIAAGTVRGPDWHARLWTSADGVEWQLARELRPIGDAKLSADDLLTDGDRLVLLASEHPCSRPDDNAPGWILGTDWGEHVRIFEGTNVDDLLLRGPGEHPFAVPPAQVDCATMSELEIGAIPYPTVTGDVVNGSITLLGSDPPADATEGDTAEDEDAWRTSGVRRIARLVDGGWEATEIDGVADPAEVDTLGLVPASGPLGVGIVEVRKVGRITFEPMSILPDGSGGWRQATPERPLVVQFLDTAATVGDRLLLAGTLPADPFTTAARVVVGDDSNSLFVWASVESVGEPPVTCRMAAGAACRFADLTKVDGYPDFAGRDLAGIDLAFAELGEADLSGARLDGAVMWEVNGADANFDGASLVGAAAYDAALGSAIGADLSGARLAGADVEDATGAVLAGADLSRASVGFRDLPDLRGVVIADAYLRIDGPDEVSLAGLDLTGVTIIGRFEPPLMRVTDLTGAVLSRTSLRRVDLTPLAGAGVELSELRLTDDSLCPDGAPPDPDVFTGGCVR